MRIKSRGLKCTLFAVWDRITLRYYFRLRKQRAEFNKIYLLSGNKQRFEAIYDKKLWGDHGSLSGAGSSLNSTAEFRKWLIKNVPKLGISKIVDAPCGDFWWMQHVVKRLNVEYHGIDIVPSLIKNNIKQHSASNITFSTSNICYDSIPDSDLLIIRDCLFHFSFEDICKVFKNLEAVEYKYLITTNYIVNDNFINNDILTGDFRVISLFNHPFNFDETSVYERIHEITENGFHRELCIFKKEVVPTELQF